MMKLPFILLALSLICGICGFSEKWVWDAEFRVAFFATIVGFVITLISALLGPTKKRPL